MQRALEERAQASSIAARNTSNPKPRVHDGRYAGHGQGLVNLNIGDRQPLRSNTIDTCLFGTAEKAAGPAMA